MTDLSLVVSFWFTHLAVLLVPGNNVLLVMAYGLTGSRRHATFCAMGIATGTIIWCVVASQGLALVMQRVPGVEPVLAAAAAAYLFHVGWKLSTLSETGDSPTPSSSRTAFCAGLIASATNLKSGVFFASAFAAILTIRADLTLTLGTIAAFNSLVWHTSLAMFFSAFAFLLNRKHVRRMKMASGLAVCLVALLILSRLLYVEWFH